MKRLMTFKGIIVMAALVVLLAIGATYIVAQGIFDKAVSATWTVVISGDGIEVYEADGTTVVNAIAFGTSFRDFFGNVPIPTHNVVVKNLSATVVEVVITGDGGDGIVPVFGPTTGDLKPHPDNAFVLQPHGQSGDMVMGYVGLTLPQSTSGGKTTTIIFRATGLGVVPPGSLNVAVECNNGSQNCEVGTESAFKITEVLIQNSGHTADVVDGSAIDTVGELSNYDVVVIGASGHSDNDYSVFQTTLRQWVNSGGGVVSTGWAVWHIAELTDLAAIHPVSPASLFTQFGTIAMTGNTSPSGHKRSL